MKAVDLFCGGGGLTRGLLDAGIEVVAGVDIDSSVHETYESNNRSSRFLHRDLRKMDPQELVAVLEGTSRRDTLIAGCAPCQTFSKHQRSGMGTSPDATLLASVGRIVSIIHPSWVLIENVPGLMAIRGFSTLRRFVRLLHCEGYGIAHGILNACEYGVPQYRRRFVLLASRITKPELPAPIYGTKSKPHETVRQWISHFPPIQAGTEHPVIPNHVAAKLSRGNIQRLRATPRDGGDRRHWPVQLELPCHKGLRRSFSDVYGRMWWDRVAPTLTARCHSLSNGRFGHPEQDRAISLREAASLQTFGDEYVFYGSRGAIASQIGNAVPVRMARILGESILNGHT